MASPYLRILIPVDGSKHSGRTVRHAIRLKDELRQPMEVLLLNVQPPVPVRDLLLDGRPSELQELEKPLKARGAGLLEEAAATLKAADIECRAQVEIGEPAPTIAGIARKYHCELIVMGTHGVGALAGLFLGSVASKVVHLASVPVLLVP